MTPMSSYEPDPKTAKLFARHKQATETIRDTKKDVTSALEDAIRQGATSPQLSALTGMSTQTIRNIAERIGVDIRVKAPTVGREVEAKRAAVAQPAPVPNERPSPKPTPLADHRADVIAALTDQQAAELAVAAFPKADRDQYRALEAASADGDRAVVATALDLGVLTETELLIA